MYLLFKAHTQEVVPLNDALIVFLLLKLIQLNPEALKNQPFMWVEHENRFLPKLIRMFKFYLIFLICYCRTLELRSLIRPHQWRRCVKNIEVNPKYWGKGCNNC